MDKMDIFAPLPLGADAAKNRRDENYNIMVRLKPGVSVQQAQADIDVIASRIREKDKRDASFGMHVIGLQEQVVGDVRRALLVLLGSVGLVLLIACANVANLLLTRAAGREKEVAIRTALGAGWQQLARQLLTESVLLGLLGGAAGLLVAQLSIYMVRTMNPGNIPRLEDIGINGAVLMFTFGVSLATGILFGVAPVWRAIKVDLNTSLKAGGRSGQSDGGLHLQRHRLRGLLVVSELTLSLMLLIGAGLLIRSFVRLQSVPPGFTTDHVLTMEVAAAGRKYQDDKNDKPIINFYREVESRIAHLPGVVAEGVVSALPLTGEVGWGGINVEGYTPPPGQELQVDIRIASTDYFRTMEIPLRKGRFFTEDDTADKPQVVIIDEKFAQRFWPDNDRHWKTLVVRPQEADDDRGCGGRGQTIRPGDGRQDRDLLPAAAAARSENVSGGAHLVRSGGLSSAVVSQIHAVDPDVVVYGIRTMQDRLHDSLARQRFSSTMLGAFAVFALLLAAVGLYGVMSLPGHAEHSRYRSASRAGRAAREYHQAGGAAGDAIGGDWNRSGRCRRSRIDSRDDQLAIRGQYDRRVHLRDRAGAAGGGSVCRDRHSGVEGNSSRSDGRVARRIAARVPVLFFIHFDVFPRGASNLNRRISQRTIDVRWALPQSVLGNFDEHTSDIRGPTVWRILSALSATRKLSRKIASNSKRASRKLLIRGVQSTCVQLGSKYRSLGAFDCATLLFYRRVTSNR